MKKSNDNVQASLQKETFLDYAHTKTQQTNTTSMMAGTRERIRPNTKATFRDASQAMNIALNPNYHTEHSAFEIKLAGPLSSRFDISPD